MLVIPYAPIMWTYLVDLLHAAFAGSSAWFAAFARAAAPEAVAALWQSATIALVVGFGLRIVQRMGIHLGAAQRFALWGAAFLAIALLPLLPALPLQTSVSPAAIASAARTVPPQPLHLPQLQINQHWALALAALWLLVALVRAAGLIRHSLALRRLWNSATPVVTDEHLRGLLAAASPARGPIELCTTRELDRPSVIGFFAPRILVPEWLFQRLSAGELEHVVLHEAEHLRRRDDWINLLQKLALVLFPLNPALVWIERRLCREREMACDEGVVRRTQAPRAYAASLTAVAGHAIERRHAHALSLGAFERRSELARRVTSLLARKSTLHPAAARALVGFAACGLIGASLELARCPQIVAFVPAAPPAVDVAQTDASTAQGDRVFREPAEAFSIPSFRAVQAKAILPANQMPSHHGYAPAPSRSKADLVRSGAILGPTKAVPLLQRMSNESSSPANSSGRDEMTETASSSRSGGRSPFGAPPEVVVFTAWEHIEARSSGPNADYDLGIAQPDSTGSVAPSQNLQRQHPVTQIRVTRLILWIAPWPIISNNAAPGSNPPRATALDSRRLPASPAESGWLVFEL